MIDPILWYWTIFKSFQLIARAIFVENDRFMCMWAPFWEHSMGETWFHRKISKWRSRARYRFASFQREKKTNQSHFDEVDCLAQFMFTPCTTSTEQLFSMVAGKNWREWFIWEMLLNKISEPRKKKNEQESKARGAEKIKPIHDHSMWREAQKMFSPMAWLELISFKCRALKSFVSNPNGFPCLV